MSTRKQRKQRKQRTQRNKRTRRSLRGGDEKNEIQKRIANIAARSNARRAASAVPVVRPTMNQVMNESRKQATSILRPYRPNNWKAQIAAATAAPMRATRFNSASVPPMQ